MNSRAAITALISILTIQPFAFGQELTPFQKQVMSVVEALRNEKKTPELGWTPLHEAAERGDVTTVKSLLASGANPNAQDESYGQSPLLAAVIMARTAAVELLLAAKADSNLRAKNGETALSAAVAMENTALCRRLLTAGANPNLALEDGETLLFQAAHFKNGDIARALLAAGADANPPVPVQSPLHVAIEMGRSDTLNALLQGKPDFQRTNEAGLNVLQSVLKYGTRDMIKTVYTAAKLDSPLRDYSSDEQELIVQARAIDDFKRKHQPLPAIQLKLHMLPTETETRTLFSGKAVAPALRFAEKRGAKLEAERSGWEKLEKQYHGGAVPGPPLTRIELGTPDSKACKELQTKGLMATNIPVVSVEEWRDGEEWLESTFARVNERWVEVSISHVRDAVDNAERVEKAKERTKKPSPTRKQRAK